MTISALSRLSWTRPAPVSGQAPAVSADEDAAQDRATVSRAPSPHAALWSSLAAAGMLGGNGPVNAVLTAQQRTQLGRVVADIQGQGGKFLVEKSWLGRKLSGETYAELSPAEATAALQPGEVKNLFCQPAGDAAPARVSSLLSLAAVETLYGKAEPTSELANSLRNLYDRGYHLEQGNQSLTRLQAFVAASQHSYLSGRGPTRIDSWLSKPEDIQKADFFEVSQDPRSLSDGAYASALLKLQADGRIPQARAAYEGVEGPRLLHQGIPVAKVEERTPRAVQEALARAEPGCRLADQHLVPLVKLGRLKAPDAGPLLEVALLPETSLPELMKLADACLTGIDANPGAWAAKAYRELSEHRKSELVHDLVDLVGAVGHEALESLDFLTRPERKEGLWALPLAERREHFKTLARLDSARDARTLLEPLSKPMAAEDVPVHVELLAWLYASGKLESSYVSSYQVKSEHERLARYPPAQALAALKAAYQRALLQGGVKHIPQIAEGVLRGWDPGLLCATVTGLGKGAETHLPALIQAEPSPGTARRYLDLLTGLRSFDQAGLAPQVFSSVQNEQDLEDFKELLRHLAREGQAARAGELFKELKSRYPGEAFAPALQEALRALTLGQSPDELLRSASTASALEQKDGQLRVGGVLLKSRRA